MASTEPAPASSMDPQQILATVRSGSCPASWSVWRLQRDFVARGAVEWAVGSVIGFGLLVPIFLTTVPANFQNGVGAVFTSILLTVFGALAFGSLALLVSDLRRLARADQYLIVLTPGDYLKLEPGRTTHVPMQHIGFVTLKGVKAPEQPGRADAQSQGGIMRPWFGGRPMRRREPRRPPSLAFVDLRTNRTVVVSTDDSFGELSALEYALAARAGG